MAIRPSYVGKNGVDVIKTEGTDNTYTKLWMRPKSIGGLAVGDRLFAVCGLFKNTPETTIISPPGWQLIINADFLRVYTKIATQDDTWPELVSLTKPQNVSFIFYNPRSGGLRPFAEFMEWYCIRSGPILDGVVGVRHVPAAGSDADPHFLPQARNRFGDYAMQFSGEVSFRFTGANYGANSIDEHFVLSKNAPSRAGVTSWIVGVRTPPTTETSTAAKAVTGWPGTHVALDSYHDFTIIIVAATPPSKPSLRSPDNGIFVDLQNYTPTFSWQYGSEDGSPQAQFSFRRAAVTNGVRGAYEYWNGTAWQATQVFVNNTAASYTFPAAKFINGVQYVWSVQVKSGVGLTSPWSDERLVKANTAPIVTITYPGATITTFKPEFQWLASDPENEPIMWSQVVLVKDEALALPGFDYQRPEATSGAYLLWNSGQLLSSTRSVVSPVSLHNQIHYTVFVRVNNGQTSTWSYQSFVLDINAPTAPILRAVVE